MPVDMARSDPWERDADTLRVASITDAAGRAITLTYAIRTVSRPSATSTFWTAIRS
jgi:hypothetical protein